MQACLQRYEASKLFIKIVFEKLRLRENLNYYFYKILISIFKEVFSSPMPIILCKQHLHAMHIKFYSKTCLIWETC
jgi:hypothetical protein